MAQFRAVKEMHYQNDIGEYTSWGIKGYISENPALNETSVYISDVFLNEKDAVEFARLCTDLDLSLVHLSDAVEDCLCG